METSSRTNLSPTADVSLLQLKNMLDNTTTMLYHSPEYIFLDIGTNNAANFFTNAILHSMMEQKPVIAKQDKHFLFYLYFLSKPKTGLLLDQIELLKPNCY